MNPPKTLLSDADRRSLDARIRKEANGCWTWLGRDGQPPLRGWYVKVTFGGKAYNLRRLLYALRRGLSRVPDRKERLTNKCNNPNCVNPQHMVLSVPPDR